MVYVTVKRWCAQRFQTAGRLLRLGGVEANSRRAETDELGAVERIHYGRVPVSARSTPGAISCVTDPKTCRLSNSAIIWEESGAGETEPGEEGMGLQLLGGWTYAYQLKRSMTRQEWSHLYDLVRCGLGNSRPRLDL